MIHSRLTNLGLYAAITFHPEEPGAGRISVQVSRADDLKRLIEFATKRARLEIRLVDEKTSPELLSHHGLSSWKFFTDPKRQAKRCT